MGQPKRRSRGIVLSNQGKERLEVAIATLQKTKYKGQILTQQKLKEHLAKAHTENKSLDIKTIQRIRKATIGTDISSVKILFQALRLELVNDDYYVFKPRSRQNTYQDLVEAPELSEFYGRNEELRTLETWILEEKCKLVAVLGIGGIGKTAIAAKLENRINQQFQCVIWRSLRENPPIEKVLSDCIQYCSNQRDQFVPDSISDSITKLIHHLGEHRCLLIFDNVESLLEVKKQTGYHYREGYDNYGNLFQRIGESKHQSCLVLTSREKPKEIAYLEGSNRPVRSQVIQGLEEQYAQKILDAEGISRLDVQWKQVFELYAGHPLALRMVAKNIQTIFGGDISLFLKEGKKTFKDIEDLLKQQFDRLSTESQSIMFWLAINREPMTIPKIQDDILSHTSTPLEDLLQSLLSCFLIEQMEAGFTLQNVIMEYVTDCLINEVIKEIELSKVDLLNSHSLIKASSKEYIYKTQCRLILNPIQSRITNLRQKLLPLLETVHSQPELRSGYAAGNILNLLCNPVQTTSNLDFSNLTIRQAYLRNSALHDINFTNAQFIHTELAHTFGVALSIAFSPDSDYLAMAGMARDGNASVSIFHVNSRQLERTLQGHASWLTRAVAFGPCGQRLASGGEDGKVCLWDWKNGQCLATFTNHRYAVWSVAFNPDGNILASGAADGEIRLWDLETHKCLSILQAHPNRAWSISFSSDGQRLASSSEDGTVCLWDVSIPQEPRILLKKEEPGRVFAIAFSPDGQMLASGNEDGTIQLWDLETLQRANILQGSTPWVWSIAFSPEGESLASSSEDGTLYLWDISNRKQQDILEEYRSQREHRGRIWSIAFSPDGTKLASSGDDHTVGLWNAQHLERIHTFKTHPIGIMAVAVSPNRQTLVSGDAGSVLRLWDISNNKCLRDFQAHKNRIWSVAFSPKGNLIASGSEDCTVSFWDVRSGSHINTLEKHYGPVWTIAFSPDGKLFATSGVDRIIRLWDITNAYNPQFLTSFERHQDWVWSVVFSPDSKRLASSGTDGKIQLWDTKNGKWLTTLWSHKGVIHSVAFSPDGHMLASGSDDGKIRLWNTSSYECLNIFPGYESRIRSVAFSSDGQILASSSEDGKTRLWDLTSFKCLRVLHEHEGPIFDSAFYSNSQQMITGSGDGTVKLWDETSDHSTKTFRMPRLYEGTNITNATGLTPAQKKSLFVLGAIDDVTIDLDV
ncbi:NB-ARC domain-containing protein [Adonisia turfae]|nr:NB-ARC domain-containing protein [Adonisia turfae]